MTEVYVWVGKGWYAPRQENGEIRYYWCGDNKNVMPETYTMGLGAPYWYDTCPC
jgi:hypothetical protein